MVYAGVHIRVQRKVNIDNAETFQTWSIKYPELFSSGTEVIIFLRLFHLCNTEYVVRFPVFVNQNKLDISQPSTFATVRK